MSKRLLAALVVGTTGLLAAVLNPALLSATRQPTATRDWLAPVAALVGRWSGTTEAARQGDGRARLRARAWRSLHPGAQSEQYPPQDKSPKGEVHEDMGVFSFDSARKGIVLRQFHTEGFVNQYVLDPDSPPGRRALTTEAIENIPAGWRARETYVFTGESI